MQPRGQRKNDPGGLRCKLKEALLGDISRIFAVAGDAQPHIVHEPGMSAHEFGESIRALLADVRA